MQMKGKPLSDRPRHWSFREPSSFQTSPVRTTKILGHSGWHVIPVGAGNFHAHPAPHCVSLRRTSKGEEEGKFLSEGRYRKTPLYSTGRSEDPICSLGFPELNVNIIQGHRSSCKSTNRLKKAWLNIRHPFLFSGTRNTEGYSRLCRTVLKQFTKVFFINTHSFSISPWETKQSWETNIPLKKRGKK